MLIPTVPAYRPLHPIYNEFENTSDAEWAIIGKHNLAYGGPVSIKLLEEGEEDQGTITHGPLTMANVPSMVNMSLVRNFTFFEGGDVLRLKTYSVKEDTHGLLYWKRLP